MEQTRSAEIEQAILAAAEQLLISGGPEALSVRRIAAAAHVAPMSVYNHFGSKNGVIDALFVASLERLRHALRSIDKIADPVEALLEGLYRYRRLALEHRAAYQIMFRWWAIPTFEPSPSASSAAKDAFSILVAAVERAMAESAIAKTDPTAVAQQLWAATHGWVSIETGGLTFVKDHDAGLEALLAVIIKGLQADL